MEVNSYEVKSDANGVNQIGLTDEDVAATTAPISTPPVTTPVLTTPEFTTPAVTTPWEMVQPSIQEIPIEVLEKIPFTQKELRLKPKQQKCPRKFIPPEAKDEKYYQTRNKNAMAVRRSRIAKEEKQRRMIIRLQFLEGEHQRHRALIQQYEMERTEFFVELQRLKRRVSMVETSGGLPNEIVSQPGQVKQDPSPASSSSNQFKQY